VYQVLEEERIVKVLRFWSNYHQIQQLFVGPGWYAIKDA